jgi:hypothetical protein
MRLAHWRRSPPDAGFAADASVVGTATASVTATGFGVVIDSGCATAAEAVEESDLELELELAPEDGLSVDFAAPDFAVLDFAGDPWDLSALVLGLAPALASEVCPVVPPRLSGLLPAA